MFRKLINTFAGTKILSRHLATNMKELYYVSSIWQNNLWWNIFPIARNFQDRLIRFVDEVETSNVFPHFINFQGRFILSYKFYKSFLLSLFCKKIESKSRTQVREKKWGKRKNKYMVLQSVFFLFNLYYYRNT